MAVCLEGRRGWSQMQHVIALLPHRKLWRDGVGIQDGLCQSGPFPFVGLLLCRSFGEFSQSCTPRMIVLDQCERVDLLFSSQCFEEVSKGHVEILML